LQLSSPALVEHVKLVALQEALYALLFHERFIAHDLRFLMDPASPGGSAIREITLHCRR